MNLSLKNLSFRYSRKKPLVLDNVSMDFTEGKICGLLGPNGAGKSTLLYLIAGALAPTSGEVTFDGIKTINRNPKVLANIFLVPEEPQLPSMTLSKFIELNSTFYPNFNAGIMEEALNEFDLSVPGRLDALSMGQKKKIVLSFALAVRTPVLLMDEPTNGLDIPGKSAFRRLVARYAGDDRLFLISTHQVRDLDQLLDHVIIMDSHRFVLDDSIYNLQQKLSFLRNQPRVPENALYSLPSLGGFDVLVPKADDDDEETVVNLEILFEAAMKNTVRLNEILL